MRKSRFSAEQITLALRQAEGGTPVEEICRKLGVSQATFFRWKRRFGSLGVPEIREKLRITGGAFGSSDDYGHLPVCRSILPATR